jgi:hypothetical protein
MTGKGHPLPGSDEARHDEIPEHLERDKGRGDDPAAAVQPPGDAVAPDGDHYPAGANAAAAARDDLNADQAAHQDRGHAQVAPSRGRG